MLKKIPICFWMNLISAGSGCKTGVESSSSSCSSTAAASATTAASATAADTEPGTGYYRDDNRRYDTREPISGGYCKPGITI